MSWTYAWNGVLPLASRAAWNLVDSPGSDIMGSAGALTVPQDGNFMLSINIDCTVLN